MTFGNMEVFLLIIFQLFSMKNYNHVSMNLLCDQETVVLFVLFQLTNKVKKKNKNLQSWTSNVVEVKLCHF